MRNDQSRLFQFSDRRTNYTDTDVGINNFCCKYCNNNAFDNSVLLAWARLCLSIVIYKRMTGDHCVTAHGVALCTRSYCDSNQDWYNTTMQSPMKHRGYLYINEVYCMYILLDEFRVKRPQNMYVWPDLLYNDFHLISNPNGRWLLSVMVLAVFWYSQNTPNLCTRRPFWYRPRVLK